MFFEAQEALQQQQQKYIFSTNIAGISMIVFLFFLKSV